MTELWYDMDEVQDFHPIVEKALKEAINKTEYSSELQVKHHPVIPNSTLQPDFGIYLNSRPVFILEVKTTKRDCNSQRSWRQTREYVNSLSTYWEHGHKKYFAVTNIETLLTFCEREGPVWSCILSENPRMDENFGHRGPNNADEAVSNFINSMTEFIKITIMQPHESPKWAETWPIVLDSFEANYWSIRDDLNLKNKIQERDITSYELLRIILYGYLKEFYDIHDNNFLKWFQNLPENSDPPKKFVDRLLDLYKRIFLNVDFEQVFKNHPDDYIRLLPEKTNKPLVNHLQDFINTINKELGDAIKENDSPGFFIELLKEKVYDREEMHKEGKITTDNELASLIAELCIEHPDVKVIDVGTGIGALSDAAYDKIRLLSRGQKTHNQILSQLYGIEKDPFLNQLATFRLIAKDPVAVDGVTKIKFEVGDAFENPRPSEFDVVLMNPPFLRHDNKIVPLTDELKNHMLSSIESQFGAKSFVRNASQPNLYFYFLNWALHYLRPGGLAGIFLSAKFLNNVDGEYVKEFILDFVESIILYPSEFFEDFKTTTCILIMRKGTKQPNVNFFRVKNSKKLEDTQFYHQIKEMIKSQGEDIIKPGYTLKGVKRNELGPSENWTLYFSDPEERREFLNSLNILVPLVGFFNNDLKRGRAENAGGSNEIYLKSPRNKLRDIVDSVEDEFVVAGLRNNRARRNFILTEQDVRIEEALGVPGKYNNDNNIGLASEFQKFDGLKDYFTKAGDHFGTKKWKQIVNNMYGSKVSPDLIIPRADRTKHSVYYWGKDEKIVISTNFFYLAGFSPVQDKGSKETQLKCICGYLMSSFGQVQFELEGHNHEGMRKLEKYMITKFKCLDLDRLDSEEIEKIAEAFEKLDALQRDVKGDEGTSTARRELDETIGNVIWSREEEGFNSPKELVDWIEFFLQDLVRLRCM